MTEVIKFEDLPARVPEKNSRIRKAKSQKEVVHPIFAACALLVKDSFWAEKFTTLSTGKMIRNFTFHDGTLTYRKNARKYPLEVSEDPLVAVNQVIKFIRSNAGISSPQDEEDLRHEQEIREQEVQVQQQLTWEEANRKVRDSLVNYFIADFSREKHLQGMQILDLNQTVRLGISQKYFSTHNIIVQDNRIVSMEGLLWNEDHQRFYISPELRPVVSRASKTSLGDRIDPDDQFSKDTVPRFHNQWTDYLGKMGKKVDRSKRRQLRGRESGLFDNSFELSNNEEASTADDNLDDE